MRSAGLLAVIIAATTARSTHADTIVLDTCVGTCTRSDHRASTAFRFAAEQLERQGVVKGVVADVLDVSSRPGMPLPAMTNAGLTAEKLGEDLRGALEAMVRAGNAEGYAQAAESLRRALAEVTENQLLVIQDPTLPKTVRRARVGLALSLWRQRDSNQLDANGRAAVQKQAIEAMGDIVRTTAESSVIDTLGPEADAVFQLSRNDLMARLMGSLTIQVDDSKVLFYLDVTAAPQRRAYSAEKFPGIYHLVALDPTGRNRRYVVEVVPGARTVFDVKWSLDQAFDLQLSGAPRIGITYSSAADRDREAQYAERARTATRVSSVIVVSAMTFHGRDGMSATLYGPSGFERAGFVPLDENERRNASALIAYVVNGTKSALVEELGQDAEADDSDGDALEPPGVGYAFGWGLGLAGISIGIGGILEGGEDVRTPSYISIGAGLTVATVTTYLFARRLRRMQRVPDVAIVPRHDGAFATAAWRF